MKNKEEICSKIFGEYRKGIEFKAGIGKRGLYEQTRINERFYVGDQWHGAKCGADRPLVRHNVIKRIGDYKTAMIASAPISVNYSADGIPNTIGIQKESEKLHNRVREGIMDAASSSATAAEINLVMGALSDYFKITGERIKLDSLKEQALRNAYISGTGLLYTYWDPTVKTGLYADKSGTKSILGDIACEVIDIENVYFGDVNEDDVQKQPYIIIAQRKSIKSIKAEAKINKIAQEEIDNIKADDDRSYQSGEYGEKDLDYSKKATVLTKFWKENDQIFAIRICEGAVIKDKWSVGIRLYPLAKFCWERRRNNTYGESEITYLVPNQIAINRMLTANVWAVMMLGMPLMVVNDSLVPVVTNEPGQVIRIDGNPADVAQAIHYVTPPNFSPNFENNISSLISNTLTQSGANDAALGNMRPDNTSAIIAVREAATLPLQTVQNRFYQFVEDVARIWAEFWISYYGTRSIKMEEAGETYYMAFNGERYKDLVVSARVDVGAASLYGEAQTIRTLDNLFDRQAINLKQYLERLPKGFVPDATGLIKELEQAEQAQQMQTEQMMTQAVSQQPATDEELMASLTEEERQLFESLPDETKQAMLSKSREVQK